LKKSIRLKNKISKFPAWNSLSCFQKTVSTELVEWACFNLDQRRKYALIDERTSLQDWCYQFVDFKWLMSTVSQI
jgi:hypothetical protein